MVGDGLLLLVGSLSAVQYHRTVGAHAIKITALVLLRNNQSFAVLFVAICRESLLCKSWSAG
jgi:hypothetical protein